MYERERTNGGEHGMRDKSFFTRQIQLRGTEYMEQKQAAAAQIGCIEIICAKLHDVYIGNNVAETRYNFTYQRENPFLLNAGSFCGFHARVHVCFCRL